MAEISTSSLAHCPTFDRSGKGFSQGSKEEGEAKQPASSLPRLHPGLCTGPQPQVRHLSTGEWAHACFCGHICKESRYVVAPRLLETSISPGIPRQLCSCRSLLLSEHFIHPWYSQTPTHLPHSVRGLYLSLQVSPYLMEGLEGQNGILLSHTFSTRTRSGPHGCASE